MHSREDHRAGSSCPRSVSLTARGRAALRAALRARWRCLGLIWRVTARGPLTAAADSAWRGIGRERDSVVAPTLGAGGLWRIACVTPVNAHRRPRVGRRKAGRSWLSVRRPRLAITCADAMSEEGWRASRAGRPVPAWRQAAAPRPRVRAREAGKFPPTHTTPRRGRGLSRGSVRPFAPRRTVAIGRAVHRDCATRVPTRQADVSGPPPLGDPGRSRHGRLRLVAGAVPWHPPAHTPHDPGARSEGGSS